VVPAQEVVDLAPVECRRRAPGLQARDVEQVGDEAVEAVGLGADVREQLVHGLLTELHLIAAQGAHRSLDRRQRRAQLVGDGAQERGLERVRGAQRLGLDVGVGKALALLGECQDARQRARHALGVLVAECRDVHAHQLEPADHAPIDIERQGDLARQRAAPEDDPRGRRADRRCGDARGIDLGEA
jgi:hypothetical protein